MTLLVPNFLLLKEMIDAYGYWSIGFIGLLPSIAFCIYVKWDDHRQAKAHAHPAHHAPAAPHGAGEAKPGEAKH